MGAFMRLMKGLPRHGGRGGRTSRPCEGEGMRIWGSGHSVCKGPEVERRLACVEHKDERAFMVGVASGTGLMGQVLGSCRGGTADDRQGGFTLAVGVEVIRGRREAWGQV